MAGVERCVERKEGHGGGTMKGDIAIVEKGRVPSLGEGKIIKKRTG